MTTRLHLTSLFTCNMCNEHLLCRQQLWYSTKAWELIETAPVNGCCMRKTVGILTGLGFLARVEGFKTTLASSQGARLLLLVKSCPLAVRVWQFLRLILPLRLNSLLSSSGPHWVQVWPLIALFSSLAFSLWQEFPTKCLLTLVFAKFEFRLVALRWWDHSGCSCRGT